MSTSQKEVVLPDLRIGNMASVANMIRKCGGSPQIVSSPDELTGDAKIILAGVGAFDAAVRVMRDEGWADRLNELVINQKIPVLGICLGMQIMSHGSEEGVLPGLGWIDAHVRRFRVTLESGLKVPHMGWNTVTLRKPNPLITNDEGEQRFYFVHSYYVECHDATDVLATTRHGYDVTAAISREHMYGVQFHPEKSHRFGLAVLQRFLEL